VALSLVQRIETPEQRPAHLVFWYESEVENGGHFQYFEMCHKLKTRGVKLPAPVVGPRHHSLGALRLKACYVGRKTKRQHAGSFQARATKVHAGAKKPSLNEELPAKIIVCAYPAGETLG
jgi:hypothetical protein